MTEPDAERPYVSESLKSAMRALEDFWNSGGNPLPRASGLGSLESRAASGRYGNRTGASIWEEVKSCLKYQSQLLLVLTSQILI